MRSLILLLMVVTMFGCKKEAASTDTLNEMISDSAILVASASFEDGPYGTVTGKAQVWKGIDNSLMLVLDSFTTTNGPDLFVYLSREVMPVNFIEAGKLKSTNGRQVYPLPGNPDFLQYRYVCIHCKAYNHLFGSARLF